MFKTVFAATLAAVIGATQLKRGEDGMANGMGNEADACLREGGFFDGEECVYCDEDPYHELCEEPEEHGLA